MKVFLPFHYFATIRRPKTARLISSNHMARRFPSDDQHENVSNSQTGNAIQARPTPRPVPPSGNLPARLWHDHPTDGHGTVADVGRCRLGNQSY